MPNLITEGGGGLETDKNDNVLCERTLTGIMLLKDSDDILLVPKQI